MPLSQQVEKASAFSGRRFISSALEQAKRAEHVMRVGGTIGRDHAIEDDRARFVDGEFRSFDKVGEISLIERLIDRGTTDRLPKARGLRRKSPQRVVKLFKQGEALGSNDAPRALPSRPAPTTWHRACRAERR